MNLLHRYIFKNVLLSCLASVTMFAFLLLTLLLVKDILSLLAEGQLTARAFFRLTWMLFPFVFVYALPMGFITGALLTMGRLSAENEITSFRAAGISIFRISSSVFCFAILGTVLSLVVNFYYGPLAKTEYRTELKNTIQKNPLGFIVEKTFVRDFPGIVIYVGEKEEALLKDLWIWILDDENRVQKFSRAEWGEFQFTEGSNELVLNAYNGAIEIRDEGDPENFKSQRFFMPTYDNFPFPVSLDRILGKETLERKLTWLTFSELQSYIKEWSRIRETTTGDALAEAELNHLKGRMQFHKTFAMGFSVLSFACIAVPLGVQTSRKETSANLGIGVGMALVYYLCMISIEWLDGHPHLRPDLLFWVPNIVFQCIGTWLFIKLDHGRKSKIARAF